MSVDFRPTVVIADDDPEVRAMLSELIVAHPGLTLVGVSDSGTTATAMCHHHRPTFVVIDPVAVGGSEAIASIRAASPSTSIIVYTARADRRTATKTLGVDGDVVLVEGDVVELVVELARLASARRLVEA